MTDDDFLGIDDRMFDRIIYSPVCTTCVHRGDEHRKCAAFEHIPDEIWNGDNPHTSPYPGDNGIQYEAYKPVDQGNDEIVILDITGMTREQAIEAFMRFWNLDHDDAEFYVAIELGEIDGDMILINSDDNDDLVTT